MTNWQTRCTRYNYIYFAK